MRPKYIFFLWLSSLALYKVSAQNYSFSQDQSPGLVIEGKRFTNAWAGGLNSPQFSKVDLNLDGTEDLIVFERTSGAMHTFLASNQEFLYAPEYISYFPGIRGWMHMADYNGDGLKDLFAATNLGMQVFKNVSANGAFALTAVYDLLYTRDVVNEFDYNLSVPVTDVPGIVDIDQDGDLDVVTMDFHLGGLIEVHRNISVEQYGHRDSLVFERVNYCWGDIQLRESNCNRVLFGTQCPLNGLRNKASKQIMHSGASILIMDLDGDGLQDALISGVGCNQVYVFWNTSTNLGAVFQKEKFTQSFPPNTTPIDLKSFTAFFWEDIDFDNQKDLIACFNLFDNEGFAHDFTQSAWYYKNVGSNEKPRFEFRQKDFLQSTQLDLGELTAPSFIDFDLDGDQDMFVGNAGQLHKDGYYATVTYFENTGTAQNPDYTLRDRDFMGLSQYKMRFIKPRWMNIDNERALDFTFQANDSTGGETKIFYLRNLSPFGTPIRLEPIRRTFPFKIQQAEFVYFYDLDQDGDQDAFVAQPTGGLSYSENIRGIFQKKIENVAGVTASIFNRNPTLSIADMDGDAEVDLVIGDDTGYLKIYTAIARNLDNLQAPFVQKIISNPLADTLEERNFGGALVPVILDYNSDQSPDIVLGTYGGGLIFLKNDLPGSQFPKDTLALQAAPWFFPNPVERYIYFRVPFEGNLQIISLTGQICIVGKTLVANSEYALSVENLPKGMYIIRFEGTQGLLREKIIKN